MNAKCPHWDFEIIEIFQIIPNIFFNLAFFFAICSSVIKVYITVVDLLFVCKKKHSPVGVVLQEQMFSPILSAFNECWWQYILRNIFVCISQTNRITRFFIKRVFVEIESVITCLNCSASGLVVKQMMVSYFKPSLYYPQ